MGILSLEELRYTHIKFRRKEERVMLTIIFLIMFFSIFGGILRFAIRATWGVFKIVAGLVVLPLVLLALLIGGLVTFAIPILAVVGVVFLIKTLARANN